MLSARLRICGKFVQDLLVAALAEASGMVGPVLVRARGGLALVALGHIAEVAEEFGLVLSVMMAAHFHLLYTLHDVFDEGRITLF